MAVESLCQFLNTKIEASRATIPIGKVISEINEVLESHTNDPAEGVEVLSRVLHYLKVGKVIGTDPKQWMTLILKINALKLPDNSATRQEKGLLNQYAMAFLGGAITTFIRAVEKQEFIAFIHRSFDDQVQVLRVYVDQLAENVFKLDPDCAVSESIMVKSLDSFYSICHFYTDQSVLMKTRRYLEIMVRLKQLPVDKFVMRSLSKRLKYMLSELCNLGYYQCRSIGFMNVEDLNQWMRYFNRCLKQSDWNLDDMTKHQVPALSRLQIATCYRGIWAENICVSYDISRIDLEIRKELSTRLFDVLTTCELPVLRCDESELFEMIADKHELYTASKLSLEARTTMNLTSSKSSSKTRAKRNKAKKVPREKAFCEMIQNICKDPFQALAPDPLPRQASLVHDDTAPSLTETDTESTDNPLNYDSDGFDEFLSSVFVGANYDELLAYGTEPLHPSEYKKEPT